jgi:predicted Holliday junction resolvase-like endonuclease
MTKEREHHAAEMAGYTERVRAEYRALEVQMRSEYDKAVAQMREAFDKREHDKDLERAQTVRADRRQSNARSRSSLVAKIAEHISPLLDGFPYNFKEVRHIGELFDFLIFVGLEEGHVDEIVFLEIKTRKGGRVSNQREKMIRDAISCGRVRYEVWTPNVKQIEIASEELPDAPSE